MQRNTSIEILTTIAEALPLMSGFEKGELIGTAKTLVMIRGQDKKDKALPAVQQ